MNCQHDPHAYQVSDPPPAAEKQVCRRCGDVIYQVTEIRGLTVRKSPWVTEAEILQREKARRQKPQKPVVCIQIRMKGQEPVWVVDAGAGDRPEAWAKNKGREWGSNPRWGFSKENSWQWKSNL